MSDWIVDWVGVGVCVKFAGSRLNRSRDIRRNASFLAVLGIMRFWPYVMTCAMPGVIHPSQREAVIFSRTVWP